MADDLNSSPGRGAGKPGAQALLQGAAKTLAILKASAQNTRRSTDK